MNDKRKFIFLVKAFQGFSLKSNMTFVYGEKKIFVRIIKKIDIV